jgi:hypothetical protein
MRGATFKTMSFGFVFIKPVFIFVLAIKYCDCLDALSCPMLSFLFLSFLPLPCLGMSSQEAMKLFNQGQDLFFGLSEVGRSGGGIFDQVIIIFVIFAL